MGDAKSSQSIVWTASTSSGQLGASEFVAKLYEMMQSVPSDEAERIFEPSGKGAGYYSIPLEEEAALPSGQRTQFLESQSQSKVDSGFPFLSKDVGFPLPAAEPVDIETKCRFVYFDEGHPPVSIAPERRLRCLCIVVHQQGTIGSGPQVESLTVSTCRALGVVGRVLGYSHDNTKLIWHKRGDAFATVLPLSAVTAAMCVRVVRCRHCGQLIPRSEVILHLNSHVFGLRKLVGAFVDDLQWGTACGDTGLLQVLSRPCVVRQRTGGGIFISSTDAMCSHQYYAVKVVETDSEERARCFYQHSVRFMMLQREHPEIHLAEYLAVRLLPGSKVAEIVMPYYEEGSLDVVMQRLRGTRLSESYVCFIVLHVAITLSVLHGRNPPIVHGDVKPEKLLLASQGQRVMLTDCDSASGLGGHRRYTSADSRSVPWMAPETRHNRRLTTAADVWGVGLLLYVLTVLPDYPAITDENTGTEELMNAAVWGTYDVTESACCRTKRDRQCAVSTEETELVNESERDRQQGFTGTPLPLGKCVWLNVRRRGYSIALAGLIARLLSHNPTNRPNIGAVVEELTELTGYLASQVAGQCWMPKSSK
uniref:Protein kinase domain-containing protein n=1 Tax=Trypanosoma congolense (strain IL3000) TaxID=1068625 RepID=G0USE6_TRYCI|nr:putative protein kinase [Trypanosoma congolense IL3000]